MPCHQAHAREEQHQPVVVFYRPADRVRGGRHYAVCEVYNSRYLVPFQSRPVQQRTSPLDVNRVLLPALQRYLEVPRRFLLRMAGIAAVLGWH
jgi:hypothetical protein